MNDSIRRGRPWPPLKRMLAVLVVTAWASGCSDPVAVPPMDLWAGPMVVDGASTLLPGESLAVRLVSMADTRDGLRDWPVRFYLSTNALISTTDDVPLRDVAAHADEVTPYWTRAMTSTWLRIPPGTAPGHYFVGAIADPDAQLPDTTRENNSTRALLPIRIGMGPSDVSVAPLPAYPGDQADFPRDTTRLTLRWTAVPYAVSYVVELDHCSQWSEPDWWSSCQPWLVWTEYYATDSSLTTGFPPVPGRWRVRGVDQAGIAGPASAWRAFRFRP